ncbi:MAG: lipopolysaccharide transport periplasmic protein LptA [Proteobacteria bacterium]|uniref:lipopolysaccharide transport periplasmic protein LptA n=1 Tax=Aquabacterium sp. TaxID=1872578 RepID=UPI0035C7071B|nr:lipopolysaccharide transport periplasmic protein LptA [Pseudomonadota bacterium]
MSFASLSHRLCAGACAVLLAGLASPGAALADKSDRSQPVVFAADAARVDEARRLNILTGNVELTKGTMLIRADRVEVRQNPDGTQTATATGGQGGRSFFRQKREGVDEVIEGEAEKIVYEGRDDTVTFTTRAEMRRLTAGVKTDEVNGQAIRYDNKTSVYQVMGSPGEGGKPAGRVKGVITPRASEPAAAPPAATPATTSGSGR